MSQISTNNTHTHVGMFVCLCVCVIVFYVCNSTQKLSKQVKVTLFMGLCSFFIFVFVQKTYLDARTDTIMSVNDLQVVELIILCFVCVCVAMTTNCFLVVVVSCWFLQISVVEMVIKTIKLKYLCVCMPVKRGSMLHNTTRRRGTKKVKDALNNRKM